MSCFHLTNLQSMMYVDQHLINAVGRILKRFSRTSVQMGSLYRVEPWDGFQIANWRLDSTGGTVCGHVQPLIPGRTVPHIRRLVRSPFCSRREILRTGRPGTFALSATALSTVLIRSVLQAFINYGSIPNNRLLRLYGFVIPNNPYDSYDLALSTDSVAPFFQQKQRFWESAGLDPISTVSLTLTDPLPKNVLRYLRIQRLDGSDLIAIATDGSDAGAERVSDSNEMEVLRFLVESISDILSSFKPQLEELERQLAQHDIDTPLRSRNAGSAAQVSLGEQRVLRLTRKMSVDMLEAAERRTKGDQLPTPARCANCDQSSAQLSRCGRCNTVMYCGRPCQVAHYKKHKAVCLAIASRNISGKDQ